MLNTQYEQDVLSMIYLLDFMQIPYQRQGGLIKIPGMTLMQTVSGWKAPSATVSLHSFRCITKLIQTPCTHQKFCQVYDFMVYISAYTKAYMVYIALLQNGIIEDVVRMVSTQVFQQHNHQTL